MVFCYFCQISFNYDYSFTWHLKSQKHIEQQWKYHQSMERSVYVSNFPPDLPTFDIERYFRAYGSISSIDVERNKDVHALIEFKEKEAAEQILNRKKHYIFNCQLTVKRCFPESKPLPPMNKKEVENNQWTHEKIVDRLFTLIGIPQQMAFLEATLKLTDKELAERRDICQFFDKIFSEYFEFSEVNIFGSTANGLGQHGCDIDLLLSLKPKEDDRKVISYAKKSDELTRFILQDIVQTQHRKLEVSEVVKLTLKNIISAIANIVRKRGEKCERVFVIPSKRCPIVRFNIQRENLLGCDISVLNRLALYNSKLVNLFMSSDTRIPTLTFTIKYWAYRRLKISSYSIVLLVIFYLQNIDPPILPTVESLRRGLSESRVQGGWECNFSEELNTFPKTQNRQNTEELLRGFFNYYANFFDFATYAACPFNGKATIKEDLKKTISSFKSTYISVQDPFELSRNTTVSIDCSLAQKILQAFSEASNILDNDAPDCIPRKDGSPWGLISLFDNVAAKPVKDEKKEPPFKMGDPDEDGHLNSHPQVNFNALKKEDFKIELKLEPPIKMGDPNEDDHLKSHCQVNFNILSACDVEKLRAPYPKNCTPGWFYHVCNAVHSVFDVGLQFSCTSEDYNPDIVIRKIINQRDSSQSSKRKFDGVGFPSEKRLKSEHQANNPTAYTQEESWNVGCSREVAGKDLGRFDRFVCHVHCRTWIGRKKAGNKIERFGCSNLEAEENISKLIVKELSYPDKPLFSFLCKVNMKPLLAVDVTLIALTNSAELRTNAFTFLQSFVPKLFRKMNNAKEI